MDLEMCCVCDAPTGNAGRGEDSMFVYKDGKEIGPLCFFCFDCLDEPDSCEEDPIQPLHTENKQI